MTAPAGSNARPRTLHVIVTCTNRKTLPVPPGLRLDNVLGQGTAPRARKWAARLAAATNTPLVAAHDLYAGEHWMIARGLPGRAGRMRAQLWVCSAGYGLIPADAQIRPYAATFSGGSDRVPGGADGARLWWHALADWAGPAPGQPRSIRSLVAADRSAAFLLALSASYLDACRDDIAAAAGQVADPDTFMVVSAGARFAGSAGLAMVPADARLQAFLGGTRQALNARIAAYLLSTEISSRAEATHCMTRLLAEQAPLTRYERKKLSDQEVIEMIACRLAQAPGISASRLLREFRDAGYACEQQRFASLHRTVTGAGP
jgi:hypothetical protein